MNRTETPEQEEKRPENTTPVTESPAVESASEPSEETAEMSEIVRKYEDLNDRYLRLMAEYDNFRKRTVREKSDIIRTAAEDLMRELLPILDNLDRATEHKKNEQTYEEYIKGIALIEDQLRAVLARAGLEHIEVVGKPFDPAIHDAVMQIESKEHDSGVVTTEVEKGYMLSGKVIRHPKVIVSK